MHTQVLNIDILTDGMVYGMAVMSIQVVWTATDAQHGKIVAIGSSHGINSGEAADPSEREIREVEWRRRR
ncbi:hypothetical protein EON64_15615 [archaeon]|nr:MAG: hypothetical protein EON64_15615 [archaeon]